MSLFCSDSLAGASCWSCRCSRSLCHCGAVLFTLILLVGCSNKSPEPAKLNRQEANARTALAKAAKYLVEQQSAADGNWYSKVYGKFNESNRSPAPTALVVYALAHLPEDLRKAHEPKMRSALDRLRSQITAKGFVGNLQGGAHYPTYVTSMVLASYQSLGWDLPTTDKRAMIGYLLSAQLSHSRGWRPEDAHFGGWDLLGDQMIERQVDGPGTNVSVSSFALEALAPTIDSVLADGSEGTSMNETAIVAVFAVDWLARLQQASTEGGFAFGPDQYSNKAGFEKPTAAAELPKLNSYGSATCDGLRSLAYLKMEADAPPVQAAENWLIRHDKIDDVPGLEGTTSGDWQKSLYYYYTMSLAKVYQLYPRVGTLTRRSHLAARLIKLQHPDGSWLNTATGMQEDDPLIATSFALIALAETMEE